MRLQPIEVVHGKPRKTLDRIGYVLGTPARLVTLNKKTNNHHVSAETVEKLKVYLAVNDITDVYVAVNECDPKRAVAAAPREQARRARLAIFARHAPTPTP